MLPPIAGTISLLRSLKAILERRNKWSQVFHSMSNNFEKPKASIQKTQKRVLLAFYTSHFAP